MLLLLFYQMDKDKFVFIPSIIVDILWVVSSFVLLLFIKSNLSIIGIAAIILIAGWVA